MALLWVVLAVVLGVAEVLTLTLALGMTAVAALGAALTAYLGGGVAVQLVVFGGVAGGLVAGVRPYATRQLNRGQGRLSGVHALLGAEAVVTAPVDSRSGQVRIGGELWSAHTALPRAGSFGADPDAPAATLPVGSVVLVVYVDGASVGVTPPPA